MTDLTHVYVLVDIGCLECGGSSEVVLVTTSEAKARLEFEKQTGKPIAAETDMWSRLPEWRENCPDADFLAIAGDSDWALILQRVRVLPHD